MATNNVCDQPTAASGKVLQGQGVGTASNFSTATYPSTATGTGKILRADGTNWVATTATYPDTAGTLGNVLTSDGTNWSSSSASGSGAVLTATGTLTNAQIKALHATPITIISAPGVGKVLSPMYVTMTMNYGGSNVFTAGAAQTINLYYSNTVNVKTILTNTDIVGNTSRYGFEEIKAPASTTLSSFSNVGLTLYNPVATEITGNAANDNTMSYQVFYFIITP